MPATRPSGFRPSRRLGTECCRRPPACDVQSLHPECESWQPPFEPNHLIRFPFNADTGGTTGNTVS
jgi:hypothetical protein